MVENGHTQMLTILLNWLMLLLKTTIEKQLYHILHLMVDTAPFHLGGRSTVQYNHGIIVSIYLIEYVGLTVKECECK